MSRLPKSQNISLTTSPSFAWAEMYLALAALLYNFDFELFDVVRERDIEYVGDFFLGLTGPDGKGVRVKVRKAEME